MGKECVNKQQTDFLSQRTHLHALLNGKLSGDITAMEHLTKVFCLDYAKETSEEASKNLGKQVDKFINKLNGAKFPAKTLMDLMRFHGLLQPEPKGYGTIQESDSIDGYSWMPEFEKLYNENIEKARKKWESMRNDNMETAWDVHRPADERQLLLNRRLKEISKGDEFSSRLLNGGCIGLLICILSMIAWYALKAYRRRQRVNAMVAQFREILIKERAGRFRHVGKDEAAYWV